ncbi:MAG: hypothetical protein IT430_00665 [Phycisphaerales bacterium]|nr:hypothetical protein [Phycisphaerales bacterium]
MSGGDTAQPDVEDDRPTDPTASQRTFARGVGFVMQGVGATLLGLSTCACCGIAFWEGNLLHSGALDTSQAAGGNKPAVLLLLTNVLGSLALVAFGLGQQSDRGRAPAIGAAATSAIMAVLYGLVVYLGAGASSGSQWPVVAAAVLALVMLLCTALTWMAAGQVLAHPPLSAAAPTVPSDAFPDPLAVKRERYDSPAEADIARRRERLEEEMRRLDELQRQVRRQNRPES